MKDPIATTLENDDASRMSITPTTERFVGSHLQSLPRQRARTRTLITAATEELLRSSLKRLRTKLDVEFATRMREARATGDGACGDDHLQIREEELVVRAEIARIETLLASSLIVEDQDPGERAAGIGSIVEVRDRKSKFKRHHVITGDYDRTIAGEDLLPVSASSPVGHALLGRAPGEQVEVELPSGRICPLEIVSVSQPIHDPRPKPLKAQPTPV